MPFDTQFGNTVKTFRTSRRTSCEHLLIRKHPIVFSCPNLTNSGWSSLTEVMALLYLFYFPVRLSLLKKLNQIQVHMYIRYNNANSYYVI